MSFQSVKYIICRVNSIGNFRKDDMFGPNDEVVKVKEVDGPGTEEVVIHVCRLHVGL
jgi:hypothetical protein